MRKCIGFGETEGECENEAGTAWSPIWCHDCNRARLDHVSGQMRKVEESFEKSGDGNERMEGGE